MRVLHLDSAREWRGGQAQLLYLARNHPDDAVALPSDAPLRAALERAGVRTLPWGRAVPAWLGISRAIASFRPNLVAAHTSQAHGAALLSARRVPLVVHRRLDFAPGRLSTWKYRAADAFIAVSRAVAGVLVRAGVAPERVRVVYDGVPLWAATPRVVARARLGIPEAERVVGAAGALVAHKDHETLLRAMQDRSETLWIAGQGPLARALRELGARLGVRVHFWGQLAHLRDWMGAIDVFAHPSREEGMGSVVAEALGAGLRVVATAAGGVPEVVGRSGLLTPVGDPAALSGAIHRMFAGVSLEPWDSRPFSVETMVRATRAIYAEVAR